MMNGEFFSVALPPDSDLSHWLGSLCEFAWHLDPAQNSWGSDGFASGSAASAKNGATQGDVDCGLTDSAAAVSVFALVACQRTGTQVLREILNTSPAIALLAEPFTAGPEPVYWHNFMRSLPAEEFPPRSMDDGLALVDRYVSMVRRDTHDNCDWYGGPKPRLRALGLDVKYNQLNCANPMFSNLQSQPLLLEYFRARKVPIVHLVRENLAHNALSMIIANQRKVWHTYDSRPLEGRYRVAPHELMGYLHWIKKEREEFVRLAQDLNVLTVRYEDLVADLGRIDAAGDFPEDTRLLSQLATFLDVPNAFRNDRQMRKVINKPYAEILENCDELVATLESSEFSEFAPTLLRAA
jgi:LPS sulfotransferase NodH